MNVIKGNLALALISVLLLVNAACSEPTTENSSADDPVFVSLFDGESCLIADYKSVYHTVCSFVSEKNGTALER